MKANFHTHTYRCNHALGSEREYIDQAVKHGLKRLGFSDHTPYIFSDGHYSNFRMRPEELGDYVSTLEALKKEYAGKIRIHIGLETEFYPEDWGNYIEFLRGKGVEYLIMGQHFAKSEMPGTVYCARGNDDAGRLRDYVNTVLEGVGTGLFSYVAHPDIINFTGDEKLFERELGRLADGIIAAGLPFELNLLGLREGRNYPSKRFLKILEEREATVILGSDAHMAEHVYDEPTIAKAMELAKNYHLKVTEEIDITRLKRCGM